MRVRWDISNFSQVSQLFEVLGRRCVGENENVLGPRAVYVLPA